jgi:serine/threonine protein kinase
MEMNLFEAIKDRKNYLPEKRVKKWIYQVLKALDYMHRNGIFHRDIKPENILLRDDQVKLADLGSCKGIYSKPPFTEYISTRWYRSPECLLTDGYYNYKMDIWGLGCVFFEMMTLYPLFPGDDEIDQVNKINSILGSPHKDLYNKLVRHSAHQADFNFEEQKGIGIRKLLRHCSTECIDIISKMLIYDADKRYTAKQCLSHEYFRDLIEQEFKINGKMSLINFRHNPMFIMGLNDSMSFIKLDDSMNNNNNNNNVNNIRIIGKGKLSTNKNYVLPDIKIYGQENCKLPEEMSPENTKREKGKYIKLPKISNKGNKMWGDQHNFMNSNDFKRSLRHNLSNQSLDKGIIASTQYEKKMNFNIKKIIKEVKKNYISPYSKKTIANNIQI